MKFASICLPGASRRRYRDDYDRKADIKLVGLRDALLFVVIATLLDLLRYGAHDIHVQGGHQRHLTMPVLALMRRRAARCAGFTLIETLAALALASLIIVAGGTLCIRDCLHLIEGPKLSIRKKSFRWPSPASPGILLQRVMCGREVALLCAGSRQ